MKKIVFNGKRISQKKIVGVGRYAFEILKEFDKICEDLPVEVLIPKCSERIPQFKNIKIIAFGGKKTGKLWEQTSFLFYLIKNRATGVNLDGTPPLLKPDITCKHDVTHLIAPDIYDSGSRKRRMSRYWHKLIDFSLKHYAKKIITVSEYAKNSILNYYHIDSGKVTVIGNAWQHFIDIVPDYTVFEKHQAIVKKKYFLAAGSQNKNKNFEWILNNARLFPENMYVIVGDYVPQYGNRMQYETYKNVLYLGYIRDEELKALMMECRAFLFPSFHEGFGIPPMEALSVGADIIISKTSCLPEIYEKAAHYIDPTISNINLDRLLNEELEDSPEKVLEKYSWKVSAKKLRQLLIETVN